HSPLELLSDAAAAWAATPVPSDHFRDWLVHIAPDDLQGLIRQPWFASLATEAPASRASPDLRPSSSPAVRAPCPQATDISQSLIGHWSGGGLHLVGIAARIIDAARFNRLLNQF